MDTIFFRKESDGQILAVFSFSFRLNDGRNLCNGGTFDCYAHAGQHCTCDLDYIKESTTPASRSESAALLAELKSVGYDPIVIKDIPPMYL